MKIFLNIFKKHLTKSKNYGIIRAEFEIKEQKMIKAKERKTNIEKFNELIKEAQVLLGAELEAECLADVGTYENVEFIDFTRQKEFRYIFGKTIIGEKVLPNIGLKTLLGVSKEHIDYYIAEVFFSVVKEFKIDNDGDDELPF